MIDQPISNSCSNYYPLGIITQYPTGNLPDISIGYHGQMDIYQIRLANFRSAEALPYKKAMAVIEQTSTDLKNCITNPTNNSNW